MLCIVEVGVRRWLRMGSAMGYVVCGTCGM